MVNPQLHLWRAFHEEPVIKLTPGTRIRQGERLRVSYYHSIIVYEDRYDAMDTWAKQAWGR